MVKAQKRITIIIPVYGDWVSLEKNIRSLKKYVNPKLHYQVLFINDCGPDVNEIEKNILKLIKNRSDFSYHRNKKNLGFIQSCNKAVFELASKGNDILLLNSDTIVTEGFVEEMQEVLYSQNNIGAVSPRSNNATIFSIPAIEGGVSNTTMRRSYKLYKKVRDKLPKLYISPIAHGFCIMIRRQVISQYGLFDEVYGKGYGEENDFCMRIRQKGWLCAIANHAYVYHFRARSFTLEGRAELIKKNEAIFLERYPNYQALIDEFIKTELTPEHNLIRVLSKKRKSLRSIIRSTLIAR